LIAEYPALPLWKGKNQAIMEKDPIWLLVAIIGIVFLFAILVGIAMWWNDFSQELRYMNNEIRRTDGAEQRHWKRQKRRLWLSLIPFVRYDG